VVLSTPTDIAQVNGYTWLEHTTWASRTVHAQTLPIIQLLISLTTDPMTLLQARSDGFELLSLLTRQE
jgi:hypothetical protein